MRVLQLGTRISPFGDLVGDLPMLGGSVAQFQVRQVKRARIKPETLTIADYAVATAPLLESFRRAAPKGRPARLALKSDESNQMFVPVSSIERADSSLLYDIYLNAPESWGLQELRAQAEPVRVHLPKSARRRVLPQLGAGTNFIDYPDHGFIAAHIEHWVHALWVPPCLVPSELGHRRNLIGRNVRVHPRAELDGAVIGDNTVIGPGCVIRESYIGPNSHLSDYTKIRHSVLGEGTHTLADASFSHVVSFGGATLANLLLRDVLLGRNCFVTTGVIFWDQSLDKTISVLHDGRPVDTERMALGGCAGHGCILGARAIIAPGRALPNRTTVVMRKEESVHQVEPSSAGTPMCWDEGRLVPAAAFLPQGAPDELDDDRRNYGSEVHRP